MRVALDTNRYVDLCNGVSETKSIVAEAEFVMLPFIVLAELRSGFAHGNQQADNERTLQRFLLKDGVTALFADAQTTYHYAALYRQLRKQGTPMPTNDMWIAALAVQHNLVLHSRDRHFEHLPQLVLV